MPAMLDRGHDLTLGGAVARQLVRDHHTRGPALLFQQLAEQALGGPLVPPLLDENVEHEAILVDGPPEPVLRSPDHQAHFVEVPLVARTGQLAADLVGEVLAELARPLAHGLVAHVEAAGGQHLFHHAKAQRKAEVEPDGVADDLAWKAVAGVGGLGCGCHAGPPTRPSLPRQAPPQVDGAFGRRVAAVSRSFVAQTKRVDGSPVAFGSVTKMMKSRPRSLASA